MTVAFSQRARNYTLAAGATGPFDFPWPVKAKGDLAVFRLRGGGRETLVLDTDYSVTLAAASASVSLLDGAEDGDTLLIEGALLPARSTAFGAGALRTADVNAEFDRIYILIQELRRDGDRAIRRSGGDVSGASSILPADDDGVLSISADGTLSLIPISALGGGAGGLIAPVEIDEGGTGATTAPQALTNLGAKALATRDTVGTSQIDDLSVTTSKLALRAVAAAQLAVGAVTLVVESATVTVPPTLPQDGKAWIVGASATGAWSGKDKQIAYGASGAWTFYPPAYGWRAVSLGDKRTYAYTGSIWLATSSGDTVAGKIVTHMPANRVGGGLTRSAILNGRLPVVWGDGAGGKNCLLGARDATLPEVIPFEGTAPAGLVKIVSGEGIHFVIDDQGYPWSAGDNANGVLGHGDTTDRTRFKRIDWFYSGGITVRDIVVSRPGYSDAPVAFFVTTGNKLVSVGRGDSGERGDGTTTTATSTPGYVLVDGTTDHLTLVDTVSVGEYPHTVAVRRTDGTFARWGFNGSGQLGTGDTVLRSKAMIHATLTGIAQVLAVSGTGASSAGNIIVLTTAGVLYGAGRNSEGQLAQGADLANKSTFVSISHSETFKTIAGGAGWVGCFGGVTATDKAVFWGRNVVGQLGTGTTTDQATIYEPSASWQGSVTDIVFAGANDAQTAYVRAGNIIYAAGYNANNNACDGAGTANVTTFTALAGLEPGIAISAWGVYGSATAYGPMVLTDDGRLLTGGSGAQGELGWMMGTQGNSAVMQEVLIRGLRGGNGRDGDDGTPGGATNLDGLSDVTITSPSSGQVLTYNGSGWVNDTISGGGGGGGGSGANLTYTASPTNGVVASDTGTDATLTLVDGTNAGLMAPAQHTKLAGIASGATANSSDATLLSRANHTGSQAASTISDFTEAVQDVFGAAFAADGGDFDWTYDDAGNAISGAIKADAVTYAKLQNVSATSRVLGRKTAGAGDAEELTFSEVLDFVGSAARGDILYRGASGWARLGAGTSGQYLKTLGAGADPLWADVAGGGGVGGANLTYTASPTDGLVASDSGTDATLTLVDGTNAGLMAPAQHTKLAGIASGATANSSDATLLSRTNHTGSQAASTISDFTEAVQDVFGAAFGADGGDLDWTYDDAGNAISGAIKAGAVTYAKLQDVSATARVIGRKTAGAGDAEELTLSEVLDLIGSAAQGDILYRGASGWARLGAGTSGQYLKTLGSGANPAWDTPSGAGGSSNYAVSPPVMSTAFGALASGTMRGTVLGAGSTSSVAATANRLYLMKFHPEKARTLTGIGIKVTTAGAAGTLARLGIYEMSEDGLPTTLLLDAGTVATDSTGYKEISISQAVSQRTYYLAVVFDGTPTITQTNITIGVLGADLNTAGTSQAIGHIYRSFTFATLPTDETGSAGGYTKGATGSAPAIGWI